MTAQEPCAAACARPSAPHGPYETGVVITGRGPGGKSEGQVTKWPQGPEPYTAELEFSESMESPVGAQLWGQVHCCAFYLNYYLFTLRRIQ